MPCQEIGYPYLDPATGNHKHVGPAEGTACTTVIVRSNLVEVPIETVPFEDDIGRGTPGHTQFCREYPESAPLTVTLTAPEEFDEVPFHYWKINGVIRPVGQTVVSFEVSGACIIAYAKYGTDITPQECPQILLPSHLLVSVTSSCEIIDTFPGDEWANRGLPCLPSVWQAQGLSLTVVNDGGAAWVGEETFRSCPTPCTRCDVGICTTNDCTYPAPPPPWAECVPGCEPCDTDLHAFWVTEMAAGFGISCQCHENTVTVSYGISLTKTACKGHYGWHGGPECGGGAPGWYCSVYTQVLFIPQFVAPEPRTATYDGTQEDCDAKVQELVNQGPFETTFSMVVTIGSPPPPPNFREMRCTGTIRAG